MTQHGSYTVHVAGDPTVDWLVIVPEGAPSSGLITSYQWEIQTTAQITAQPGGAALLRLLVAAVCEGNQGERASQTAVQGVTVPEDVLFDPRTAAIARTYTTWRPHPKRADSRQPVWRMANFLGLQAATARQSFFDCSNAVPSCLLIDDAALGFRHHPEFWPTYLRDHAASPEQIILKMSNPLAVGPLWDHLIEHHASALTVYCAVGDLRKEFAPIGQPLSWERISSDIVAAVTGRDDLTRAARVIVSVGMSGAVLVERDGTRTLVFDPTHQEGDWEHTHPGIPTGLGTCIAAALATECARLPHQPDWEHAVRRGLGAGRAVHEHGFRLEVAEGHSALQFPVGEAAGVLRDEERADPFQAAAVPTGERWQIFTSTSSDDYHRIAAEIVIAGDREACRGIPVERIGAWASVDRSEIENMRSVRNIMREYLLQTRRQRPLSLAVFGPPGSGKSFAIKQMAREWMGGSAPMAVLEFNLSQFAQVDDLASALQRVRDCAVEQRLPLVFWDEFDSTLEGRELGWLAQFLAPMQDGVFLEAGVARPIGPGIFVFAGGTHPTMASFKARAIEIPSAKATDFLSRLRGYVDILGPNPNDEGDRTFVLRRALLLRALIQQRAPQMIRHGRLDIDPGVLQAFLNVTTYVHGARSMESIVDMSALSGKLRYERSALPPHHQLGLHVDPTEFLGLVWGGTVAV